MNKYDHKAIEEKWQKTWNESKINKIDLDASKKPFYNLMMFPYPSAEGLHIGSVYTFTGIDTFGRYKRMNGYDVFQPFGLDGFGIHSENFALKIKENILDVSKRTEKHYYEQMEKAGNMIDWSRKLETYNKNYYKWTQWLFVQLFKAGLAYRKESDVNWCPSCQTVLSDEQVIDGNCERCGTAVIKKSMKQWFFKITQYTERLLNNLDHLDWVEDVKTGQRNWIGKKEGIEIDYPIMDSDGNQTDELLTVFTTRPDTNFGATFVVISPEHPMVKTLVNENQMAEVDQYLKVAKTKSDLERTDLAKDKTGVFTGSYCYSRLTKTKLPIWIADFVLMNFGTGAVVGVPGHDKKDFEFAKKYKLPIIRVVEREGDKSDITEIEQVFEDKGIVMNSDFLDGLDIFVAKETIMDELEKRKEGRRTVSYRLRDWCVSRQRYWGPPIPMVYCRECENRQDGYYKDTMPGWWPEENLPVELPILNDFKDTLPDGSGKGALAKFPEFFEVECPHCRSKAERETDVSDAFVDSAWYFLRYPFTEYDEIPFGGHFDNPKSEFQPQIDSSTISDAITRTKKWLPVTSYIGGKEHTVLHLLYARFITMVLHDMGYIDFEEPFSRFYAHGLITKDGAKMSKSKGNVINPDEYFGLYGADSVRMYLRFMGPFDKGGDWSDAGMKGMYRFVNKLHRLFTEYVQNDDNSDLDSEIDESTMHKTIKKITEELEGLKFNTSVAEIMKLVNWFEENKSEMPKQQAHRALTNLALLLAPFMPHFAEEAWEILGNENSIHFEKWPNYDESKIIIGSVPIAIQINGKVRGVVITTGDENETQIIELAKNDNKLSKYILKAKPVRTIYIEGKILNIIY